MVKAAESRTHEAPNIGSTKSKRSYDRSHHIKRWAELSDGRYGGPPGGGGGKGRSRMKLLVTGALSCATYEERVNWMLDLYFKVFGEDGTSLVVIEGGLSGVDRLVREWSINHSPLVEHVQVAPDWKQFGREAVFVAHDVMFVTERPDVVLVFHDNLRSSPRVRDVLRHARNVDIPEHICASGLPIPYRVVDPLPRPAEQEALFDGWGEPSKGWQRKWDDEVCSLFEPWEEP